MAAPTKLYGRDLKEYEDIDVDALLETLTAEEIEELGTELIDPDDSCVPPSERCKYRLDKAPTGPFNRRKLIAFLEKKAKEEKDWDEVKPFTKEIRGKVWKPKEEEKIQINEDESVDTEWDEVLANATEEELVDLAAILGFHGMLNQVQYHKAFVSGEDKEDEDEDSEDEDGAEKKKKSSGFSGVAKHQDFKLVPDEPPNPTDVEDVLKRMKDNDPKLKEVNLNNIKNLSLQKLKEFAEALKKNTVLESFSAANTKATDRVARAFAEALKENKTIKTLNLESNYISGNAIVDILEAVNKNETLIELRVANQRPALLGCKVEYKIADLMYNNTVLLRFGIFLDAPDARVRLQDYLQRNNDRLRQKRVGIDPPEIIKREVKEYKSRRGLEVASAPPPAASEPAPAPKPSPAAPKKEAAPPPKKKDTTTEESESESESSTEESSEEE